MKRTIFGIICIIFFAGLVQSAHGQPFRYKPPAPPSQPQIRTPFTLSPDSVTITVTRRGSTDAVEGVAVAISGVPARSGTTDRLGHAYFNMPDGSYTVRLSKTGYDPSTRSLTKRGITSVAYEMVATSTVGAVPATSSLLVIVKQITPSRTVEMLPCVTISLFTRDWPISFARNGQTAGTDTDGTICGPTPEATTLDLSTGQASFDIPDGEYEVLIYKVGFIPIRHFLTKRGAGSLNGTLSAMQTFETICPPGAYYSTETRPLCEAPEATRVFNITDTASGRAIEGATIIAFNEYEASYHMTYKYGVIAETDSSGNATVSIRLPPTDEYYYYLIFKDGYLPTYNFIRATPGIETFIYTEGLTPLP